MAECRVAALYKFANLPNFKDLQGPLKKACDDNGVMGTLLLASEGVNGTIAGSRDGVENVLNHLRADPRLADLVHKDSFADSMPFYRMKVRLKKEIVTMGVEDIDPNHIVGTYVKPEEWNDLISQDDVILIDTRNDYEVEIGTFKGAVDPKTETFREFPEWAKNYEGFHNKPRIAMFCTGGIRCEKSTAYMKAQGFDDVYHLEGGILKYLETIPADESMWEGDCFVFDHRVSVKHGLEVGDYGLCNACRRPITEDDRASDLYERGVSCPKCHGEYSAEKKAKFRQRQMQMDLAAERGQSHIGQSRADALARREQKIQIKEAARQKSHQKSEDQQDDQ